MRRLLLFLMSSLAFVMVTPAPSSATQSGPWGCGYDLSIDRTEYTAWCPTSAPGTEWRAKVTWHTPSNQYYSFWLVWYPQTSYHWGTLNNGGKIDGLGTWQTR
jgi:hypothetical protein